MKNLYISLMLIAFLCLFGWAGRSRGQTSNARRPNWEYRVDPVPGTERSMKTSYAELDRPVVERNRAADEGLINQRAAEGWELAAVGGSFYYFRRPK